MSTRTSDDKRGLLLLDLNLIEWRQDLDDLVAVAERGGEVILQVLAEHAIHGFGMERKGGRSQLCREVLLILKEEAPVGGIVEIPCAGRELVEDVGLERGEITTGTLKAIDELIFPQSVNGTGSRRKRGNEDEACGVRSVGVSVGRVDLFNLRIATVRNVVSDGLAERRVDGADLGGDFVEIQIEIVGMDEVDARRLLGVPKVRHDHLHEADDPSRLLESLVLFELTD